MDEGNPHYVIPAAAGAKSPTPPRRKIRKGTQSCWECKRRKIRCTFATTVDTICDGCKSRQTKCISQEFQDEGSGGRRTKDRLRRMESLVENLAKQVGTGLPEMLPQARRDLRGTTDSSDDNAPTGSRLVELSTLSVLLPRALGDREASDRDELSRALLEAWPREHDLDLILSVPVGTSVLFHGTVCTSYSSFLREDMPCPRDMLQPPLPGLHPVLIARKLLMLATFLQGVPSCSNKDLDDLNYDYRDLRSHLVETANRLVTSNDDIVGSIEGVECIMIESMYQNNAGSLRRAWLLNRRAMTLAQMMGIHGGIDSPPPKILEPETRTRVDPERMWFRLISSDRYLSMMLGLPQASLDGNFAAPNTLESCTPMERMERLDTMAGGLILQRNSNKLQDLSTTYEIDRLLQEVAVSMPPQWWLVPDRSSLTGHDADAFTETIRLMNHFAHYHLLAQLHLPYLLYSGDRRYDYSKITAVNASREILTRFVSFRDANSTVVSYCRGVDFLAFIASTTLCLAHIDAYRQQQIVPSEGATVFHFLAHQRPGDRGMMERTVESMENMARSSDDPIAREISNVLRHLLLVEADAARGSSYSTSASYGPGGTSQCGGSVSDNGKVLHVYIPYLGALKIERGDVSKPVTASQAPSEDGLRTADVSQASDPSPEVLSIMSTLSSHREREEQLHTWTSMNHPAVLGMGVQSDDADLHLNLPSLSQQPEAGSQDPFGFTDDAGQEENLLVPATTASFQEWALQGVDMALFQSLIRGAMEFD